MEVNKILSADILDLVFEGRNKDYGAYELRKSYNKRITKALVITAAVALLALLGSFLANQIAASRIETKAWGGSRMLHDKNSDKARRNVRVEVEVLEE